MKKMLLIASDLALTFINAQAVHEGEADQEEELQYTHIYRNGALYKPGADDTLELIFSADRVKLENAQLFVLNNSNEWIPLHTALQ